MKKDPKHFPPLTVCSNIKISLWIVVLETTEDDDYLPDDDEESSEEVEEEAEAEETNAIESKWRGLIVSMIRYIYIVNVLRHYWCLHESK